MPENTQTISFISSADYNFSAVGEGGMAINSVHRYLAKLEEGN